MATDVKNKHNQHDTFHKTSQPSPADNHNHSHSLTFFLHPSTKALAQPTVPALVPLVLVHDAVAVEAARVHVVLAHAAPEEPLAAVAAGGTIVFPCGTVSADGAVLAEDAGGS